MNTAADPYAYHDSPSLAEVNLEEFLHSFDDPLPLDILHGDGTAIAQTANEDPHDFTRDPLVGLEDDLPSGHVGELPQDVERDENSTPTDKQYKPKVWSLSPCTESVRQLSNPQGRREDINLEASLNGLFFKPGELRTASDMLLDVQPSSDLICYRRNLFKVNATVVLPSSRDLLVADVQPMERIVGLHVQIQATESMKGKKVDLIKAPSKNAPTDSPDETQPLPVSIRLDHPDVRSRPPIAIAWERLQFRRSTIKSPRATRPQQTYRIVVEVVGILSGGRMVSLTRSESSPIIVRGRSPKSYLSDQKPQGSQTGLTVSGHEVALAQSPPNSPDTPDPEAASRLRYSAGEFRAIEEIGHIPDTTPLSTNENHLEESAGSYTYIPMPIMDWSPPVEAFLQPHRVHHKKRVESRPRSTTKRRYYLHDDPEC